MLTTLRSGFFGSDGFGYFLWTTELAIFDVSYIINASVVSNENSQIQNGGHYNDSTMFCLGQKIHISARVAVH